MERIIETPLEAAVTDGSIDRVCSIRKIVDVLLSLGLSPLPVAPCHKTIKKKDGTLLFTGKNPSYLDRTGRHQILNHRQYQTKQPTQVDIDLWWSNPDNGVGSLGSETLIWVDVDRKDFDSKESCDRAYLEWLEKYPVLNGAWKEQSQSGGYRILVEVDSSPGFTNFSFLGEGQKHHGECLGLGRFAVLSPTRGTSDTAIQDYSLIENLGSVVKVGSLEAIGIYEYSAKKSVSTRTKAKPKTLATSVVKVVSEVPAIDPSLTPISLLDLLAKSTKAIMDGEIALNEDGSPDRSLSQTTAIKEIYGWGNWLTQKGISFSPSTEEVFEALVQATQTGYKGDRVIDGINLETVVPACYGDSRSDLGPWQQIKRVDLETFEARCPDNFKEMIESLDAEWKAKNNIQEFTKLSALDSAKQGLPLPITVTFKKGKVKMSLPGEVDTARYINVSSKGCLAWHPTEKRFYRYNTIGGYWDYTDEVELKRLTSKVIENTDEGDATNILNFSYIPQVVKSLNISSENIPTLTNKDMVPFVGTWFDIETKDWIQPNKDVFITTPLPIAPIKGDFSFISDWLMKAVKGDQGNYDLLRCLFWLVLTGDVSRQVYFEIVGKAGTGKGVLCEILSKMVGHQNQVSTSLSRLAGSRFELASLHRKRLIVLPDQKSYSGSCDDLKRISGGDDLPLEFKGDPNIGNFKASGVLVVTANDFLRFSDEADALDRRRIPIKFDVKATEEEKLNHVDFAGYLSETLPQWIDHILSLDRSWVYRTISNRKELTHDARLEQMLEANPMAQWLSDCVVVSKGAKTSIGDRDKHGSLYGSYSQYCGLHGLFALSTVKFRGDLERQLETVLNWSKNDVNFKRVNNCMTGFGLGLKDVHIGVGFDPVTREPNLKSTEDLDEEF